MSKRKLKCLKYSCDERPVSAGYCAAHYAEQEEQRKRREDAVRFLHHYDIDGERLTDAELKEEAVRLWERWRRVCDAVNYQRFTKELPEEEAQYAVDWCIGIAQQIIEAERAVRAGKPKPYRWPNHWERFENLDKGLMSNGIQRPSRR